MGGEDPNLVLRGGLEPPHLAAYAPQAYVSTIPPSELSVTRKSGVKGNPFLISRANIVIAPKSLIGKT